MSSPETSYLFLYVEQTGSSSAESVDFVRTDPGGTIREEGSLSFKDRGASQSYDTLMRLISDPDTLVFLPSCFHDQYRLYRMGKTLGKSLPCFTGYCLQVLFSIFGIGAKHRLELDDLKKRFLSPEDAKTPALHQLLAMLHHLAKERGETFQELLSTNNLDVVSYLSDDIVADRLKKERQSAFRNKYLSSIDWNSVQRFLFFDVECSNCIGGQGKICEFGYLMTDTDLNPVQRGEMIINPGRGYKNDFHLKDKDGNVEIHLKYEADDYKRYRRAPELDRFLPRIDSLLSAKDTLLFGFSVDNDLKHLRYGYERYFRKTDIEPKNFVAFDVQSIYMKMGEHTSRMSLDTAVAEYGEMETDGSYHEAAFDAEATARALKSISEHFNKSVKELIELTGEPCIQVTDFLYDDRDIYRLDTVQKHVASRQRKLLKDLKTSTEDQQEE